MKKTSTAKSAPSLKKIQQKADREQLKQLVFRLTEDKVEKQFSDRQLDREHEKIQLLNGGWVSLYEVQELIARTIAGHAQPYEVTFPPEFYRQIYRLTGRAIPEGGITEKPHIIALYTNQII